MTRRRASAECCRAPGSPGHSGLAGFPKLASLFSLKRVLRAGALVLAYALWLLFPSSAIVSRGLAGA
jgi:hypothetical protein